MASTSAAAASALPPPRPAATGIRFSSRTRQRGSTPASSARQLERAAHQRVSVEADDLEGRPHARSSSQIAEIDPLEDGRDLVVARRSVAARRRSARLILAAADVQPRRVSAAAPRGARTPRARAPRRERSAGRPDRLKRADCLLSASRRPPARARSRASCADARTRPERRRLSLAYSGPQRPALASASERRVDVRRRTEAASRATGWNPARAQVSWTSTDTAPYARVPGEATKRSATSRWSMTHQRVELGSPSRLSTQSGVAIA